METEDRQLLERSLDQLRRLLFADGSLDGAMQQIAHLAVNAVPPCDCCSVSLVADDRVITSVSTSALAEQFDSYQYEHDQGPCLETTRTGGRNRIASVADETRWPEFVAAAGEAGLHSSCSVPLRIDGRAVGALNLYSMGPPFDEGAELVSDSFAQQAAVALANAEAYQRGRDLVDNLRIALESRDVIGQAKGIIMERERTTADQAFDILRSVSQTRNIKLRDLAQWVVDTGTWNDPPGP